MQNYPGIEIESTINRSGLNKKNIANVRFYTTIQDFKINIYKNSRDPFQKYLSNPEWFTAECIISDSSIIQQFLAFLDATGSQGDKRSRWMKAASEFIVVECDGDAYNIYDKCNRDVLEVRELLADKMEIGFSRKKADMFLRDMFDWGVWEPGRNLEQLNVSSDANTIRVALRTGLLEIHNPLLASYLDVYCYQYSYVDEMTQRAWRKVWEVWSTIKNNHRPPAPASMDYIIYKSIGKRNCKKNKRKCDNCLMDRICPDNSRNIKFIG